MRFSATTLGCKANQYDTGIIEGILRERGYWHVKPGDGCDVCIINTCAVTAESVRKSRQAIRRLKRLEPAALIAVCGCYSGLESDAVLSLGADLIGDAGDRECFANKVEAMYQARHLPGASQSCSHSPPPPRTRALLKIQDGCDNYCAYCIIPYTRGISRSMPLLDMAKRADSLERQGFKEIVITGIEISSYRSAYHRHSANQDVCRTDLIAALDIISMAAKGARLRLGSLDPKVLTDGFIEELSAIPNLCGHFHISLQSGCDKTLARMGREYTSGHTLKAMSKLRGNFPDCAITADLIVGFPGETDAEFEQTLAFIEKAAFAKIHIFPFSERPGTRAADMPGKIEKSTVKKRAQVVGEAEARCRETFLRSQIGKTLEVLFERQRAGRSIGLSRNYLSVSVRGKIEKNTLQDVTITGIEDGVLQGEVCTQGERKGEYISL